MAADLLPVAQQAQNVLGSMAEQLESFVGAGDNISTILQRAEGAVPGTSVDPGSVMHVEYDVSSAVDISMLSAALPSMDTDRFLYVAGACAAIGFVAVAVYVVAPCHNHGRSKGIRSVEQRPNTTADDRKYGDIEWSASTAASPLRNSVSESKYYYDYDAEPLYRKMMGNMVMESDDYEDSSHPTEFNLSSSRSGDFHLRLQPALSPVTAVHFSAALALQQGKTTVNTQQTRLERKIAQLENELAALRTQDEQHATIVVSLNEAKVSLQEEVVTLIERASYNRTYAEKTRDWLHLQAPLSSTAKHRTSARTIISSAQRLKEYADTEIPTEIRGAVLTSALKRKATRDPLLRAATEKAEWLQGHYSRTDADNDEKAERLSAQLKELGISMSKTLKKWEAHKMSKDLAGKATFIGDHAVVVLA
ncbi:hypothetical protein CYMTET_30947 [Cymbomonas tetramitiformis]|uniref:Uncharacterized protein n=1 Tax=Cymbomonas tetramitiformis TaxID=36881 RepID=A0AAE0FHT7_9CHLO|nr:hypothetical protein CYMTET_30947 [Cymbomonas tetramitiformis]